MTTPDGNAGLAAPPAPLPRWLPWVFVGALVLPFHPFWLDFEQVRRGLLLLLAGGTLLLWPRLPRVRGENAVLVFVGCLFVAAVISMRSLQPWEAAYRLAHWLALGVVLRLGASSPQGFATPVATLLLATSAFGIAQRFGLPPIGGYGVDREPVSVFGNLNVAAEWTTVAATVTAVLGARPQWLAHAALFAAGGYLCVDGSRSGLYALPVAFVLLTILRPRRGGLAILLAATGALGAWVGTVARPAPPPIDAAAAEAEAQRADHTLEVRYEIARGCTKLFAERPVFGWGPGQFQVQYPRVRSQQEIELSSHGRQFATEVRTAHDDWLELLVDGGLPILFVFAAMLFALQRGNRDKARLVPLFAVLLLMFVRAPLGNAPAIAAALLLVGTPATGTLPPGPGLSWGMRALGATLAALGLFPVVANTLFAPYQAAAARREQPPQEPLHDATAWLPWEPRFLQLLAQEQLAGGQLPAARRSAALAARLRPHDPQLQLLVAEVLARGTAWKEAAQIARSGLEKDPAHPELRVLLSTVNLQQGDVDGAVLAVVEDPHPVLRAQLPRHFASLEKLAEQLHQPAAAARCRFERTCLELPENLGKSAPGALDATNGRIRAMFEDAKAAGLLNKDLRPYLFTGVQAHVLGDTKTEANARSAAQKLDLQLPEWQRALLGDALAPIRNDPGWAQVLR